MATNSGKKARRNSNKPEYLADSQFREIHPLNYIQETYLQAIKDNEVIFGIGSAGTGKTFLAASYAAKELYHRRIDKIILTRPNVETGRSLGALPGTLEEKYYPYLDPFESVFTKCLGTGYYEYCLKTKAIEPKPLGFMRGGTFDNAIVLVDEAQNATKAEMKMVLSRFGKNTKMILSGDPHQVDIKDSGLEDAVKRLGHIRGIEIVNFLDSDIVRSRICKEVILAYR